MITNSTVSAQDWEVATGWHLEEHGWCEGDRCIPLRGLTRTDDGLFDTTALAHATTRASFAYGDLISVGPEFGDQSSGIAGSQLPSLTLQDRSGNNVTLDSLVGRRRRMVLHAWAPW
jgi:hypothetical protein